ncbi:MAG: MFS transporter [Actinobacteria bacterium]|nr:MFS transporter [Actinomycetota bacterium]
MTADIHNNGISMRRRWLLFAIVFFVSVICAFTNFKAPPLFIYLIDDLGFTQANIGWVMSMFSLFGVILAFPAGGILAKVGYKPSLTIITVCMTVGCVLGAFSNSVPVFLVSRMIEGIAFAFACVVAPAAVATLFPREKQGLVMGIYATWSPVGMIIAFNASPALAGAMGWQSVWWLNIVLAIISLLLVALLYKHPEQKPIKIEGGESAGKPNWKGIVLASLVMGLFAMSYGSGLGSFYPTFLQEVHGMSAQSAGFATSITSILNVILGPIIGIISDKLQARKGLMVLGMVGISILFTFAFSSSIGVVWTFIILMSIPAATVPTGVFAIVPNLAHNPAKVGLAMASVIMVQNLGIVIGSAGFGALNTSLGWNTASLYFLVPAGILGLVCALLIREKKTA